MNEINLEFWYNLLLNGTTDDRILAKYMLEQHEEPKVKDSIENE